jgi:hypothetical protein
VGRLKAGVALDDRAIFKSPQILFYTLVRSPGNFILACFDTLHVDAHIAVYIETVFGPTTSDMCCVRTGHECLCGNASRINAGATKLVTFSDRDRHARGDKPFSQRRACLTGPDDDGIEML